jgi:hypothetical protein
MRTTIAAAAIAASLIVPGTSALAQLQNPFTRNRTANGTVDPNATRTSSTQATDPDKKDLLPNNTVIPPPTPVEELKPTIPLPTGPLEPYMLTKENGPFMVLAYSFRGPDAPRQALALVLELRGKYRLPAYLLLPKKFPGRSNIRGVAPQASQFAQKDDVGLPEILRVIDEAAVMVGDEKTTKDAFDLMHKIKKLHPVCIDGQPQMWHFRKGQGLSRAMTTTNPFVPAEELFPRAPDVMVTQMNGGPHNIRYCPGRYTLQVANFGGRSSILDPDKDPRFKGQLSTRNSPLATAHEDAERLAEALSKDREVMKTGSQVYVYHDRYSSRVTIGSFNNPADPAAQKLHDRMIELAVDLAKRGVTDTMIVPAGSLLDLGPIKSQLTASPTATASNASNSTNRQ